MTKFLTLALRVLPLAFLALSAQAQASVESRACFALFSQGRSTFSAEKDRDAVEASIVETKFRIHDLGGQTVLIAKNDFGRLPNAYRDTLLVGGGASDRLMSAIRELRQGWVLTFERRVDRDAAPPKPGRFKIANLEESAEFIPYGRAATISIPLSALATNDTLTEYFESLLPIVRDHRRRLEREDNLKVTQTFDDETQNHLNAIFEKYGTRIFLKDVPYLGLAYGNTVTIDKRWAKRAEAVGTVAHELYHVRVSRNLDAEASITDIARATFFILKTPHVMNVYKSGFRGDEFEARKLQIHILNRRGLRPHTSEVIKSAEVFRKDQHQACELALSFFDEAKISIVDVQNETTNQVIRVNVGGDLIDIPLVRPPPDLRAFAKQVLTRRLEMLRAK